MARIKTEAAWQGGSCGSTSSSPAQKQSKTGTKQNLEDSFFQIRSCGAEPLTLALAAVAVRALSLRRPRGSRSLGAGALAPQQRWLQQRDSQQLQRGGPDGHKSCDDSSALVPSGSPDSGVAHALVRALARDGATSVCARSVSPVKAAPLQR